MQQFTYTIQDPLGIHARPAGMLTTAASPLLTPPLRLQKATRPSK